MDVRGSLTRHAARWATGSLVLTLVGAAALAGAWAVVPDSGGTASSSEQIGLLVTILSFGVTGAVLVDRRPDLPFGWLLAGTALLQILAAGAMLGANRLLESGGDSALMGWGFAASSLFFLPIAAHGLVYVRFPSGRVTSRAARVAEVLILAGTALVVLGGLFGATNLEDAAPASAAGIRHPLTGGTTFGAVMDGLLIGAPLVILLGLAAGIGVVVRFVRAEGLERQQLKWMTVGIVASILLFPLAVAELTGVIDPVANLLFVLTLAIPVLRYRLWAIDTIIRRSLVYATITALIVPGYVLLSALGALVFSERVGGTVAAAVVVVAVLPLQNYTRQLIDRRVYGRRDDPYRAVSDLGRRLSETPPFGRLLPVVVETIAESLRLPYVAIEGADGTILTAHGEPGSTEARWSLTYEGLVEGHLVATPRRGEDGFDERDERLLADLARQAGSVVRAEALSADLIDSRQRLVAAREEERRRLRRDLHDGLGPILTAVGLNLDAARAQLRSEPGAAEGYIDQAKDAARQALDDVRRLVYGLRPPALDSLGLVEALRVQTSQLQSDQMTISICATDMPPLPAALEVAAYRTAIEAVTNSVRHVHASNCTVSLSVECEELVVDVRDDGRSAERWVPGVGLTSLREQADELGGTLTAGPTDAGGHVRARYPIVGAAV